MLYLPNTTLIIIDCIDSKRAEEVINKCISGCSFGSVKLLTSLPSDSSYLVPIEPITSLVGYSEFCLKNLWRYCDTSHMQIVQHDGWILNPQSWEPDWFRYDYIGPLFVNERRIDNNSVGSGGFSFRSRKLMKFVSDYMGSFVPGWGWHAYINEDGVISKGMKKMIADNGFAFCPPDRAAKYAYGGNLANYCSTPFGFHGFYALRKLDPAYNALFDALVPEGANT